MVISPYITQSRDSSFPANQAVHLQLVAARRSREHCLWALHPLGGEEALGISPSVCMMWD